MLTGIRGYASEEVIGVARIQMLGLLSRNLITVVLVRVSIAMMEHHDQIAAWERKGFIWLTFLHCCSSLKEVRTRTQTGQEPGGKS